MSFCILCIIGLISIILTIYLLAHFVLNEKQIYMLKYTLYLLVIMFYSIILMPVFLLRPQNAYNIRLTAVSMSAILDLFGLKYRIENGEVFDKLGPCVIVGNHQSSIDLFGMVKLWIKYIRYCTILAKKELLWAIPFGPSTWLAGLIFVDRKNRERSSKTMSEVTKKVQNESLRLWVFPEGTRHMGETLLPFKFGAFRLAIDAQVPIVPVVFSDYKSIYNSDKENNIYYWRHGCITIKCLEPIETKGMTIEKDLYQLSEMTRQRMIDAYQTIHTTTDDKKEH